MEYSAKKNKTKITEEYSVLNPETNSDSASGKSKGVLLVSANIEIKNKTNKGKKKKAFQHQLLCKLTISNILKLSLEINKGSNKNAK